MSFGDTVVSGDEDIFESLSFLNFSVDFSSVSKSGIFACLVGGFSK